MTSRAPETRVLRERMPLSGLLLVGAALVLCSFLSRQGPARVELVEQPKRVVPTVIEPPSRMAQIPAQGPLPAPAVAPTPSATPSLTLVDVATDGLPYMPAASDAQAPTGPVHPHPISAEHARIFRENATIQALNDAMDSKDADALRRSLSRYRVESPEDGQQLLQGYELIANCLERRAGYQAAAQRYFDEETASSLRRFVLRHCLAGP